MWVQKKKVKADFPETLATAGNTATIPQSIEQAGRHCAEGNIEKHQIKNFKKRCNYKDDCHNPNCQLEHPLLPLSGSKLFDNNVDIEKRAHKKEEKQMKGKKQVAKKKQSAKLPSLTGENVVSDDVAVVEEQVPIKKRNKKREEAPKKVKNGKYKSNYHDPKCTFFRQQKELRSPTSAIENGSHSSIKETSFNEQENSSSLTNGISAATSDELWNQTECLQREEKERIRKQGEVDEAIRTKKQLEKEMKKARAAAAAAEEKQKRIALEKRHRREQQEKVEAAQLLQKQEEERKKRFAQQRRAEEEEAARAEEALEEKRLQAELEQMARVRAAAEAKRLKEEKRQAAAEAKRLKEEKRRAAAEATRLEEERKRAAEKAEEEAERLRQEQREREAIAKRRQAEEQAAMIKLQEEKRKAAEREEAKRLEAEKRAAEQKQQQQRQQQREAERIRILREDKEGIAKRRAAKKAAKIKLTEERKKAELDRLRNEELQTLRMNEKIEADAKRYAMEQAAKAAEMEREKAERARLHREQKEAARVKKEKEKEKRATKARQLLGERRQFWENDQKEREDYFFILNKFCIADISRQNGGGLGEEELKVLSRVIGDSSAETYNQLYPEKLFSRVHVSDPKNKDVHGRSGIILGWNKNKNKYKIGLETKKKNIAEVFVNPENLEIPSASTSHQTRSKPKEEEVEMIIATQFGIVKFTRAIIETLLSLYRQQQQDENDDTASDRNDDKNNDLVNVAIKKLMSERDEDQRQARQRQESEEKRRAENERQEKIRREQQRKEREEEQAAYDREREEEEAERERAREESRHAGYRNRSRRGDRYNPFHNSGASRSRGRNRGDPFFSGSPFGGGIHFAFGPDGRPYVFGFGGSHYFAEAFDSDDDDYYDDNYYYYDSDDNGRHVIEDGTTKEEYAQVLGIEADASATEIRSAFKRNALKYHPDKYKGEDNHDGMTKEEVEEHFKRCNAAHEYLMKQYED